ncbi:urease accessory protein UreD [Sphingobium sp.]|uniref:urease accessory protein UreD n=1 Tax=Sphingobium sp. TaxID=1912891 RepID=UPI001A31EA29|nr:urease accessory protein UreD [Sphingobium sp.]MBJ7375412.1 urease accessory protein UreD [Sphingobium sp.]MBJ7375413.1 urease accessory protein UreD [Sphingobium sp.]
MSYMTVQRAITVPPKSRHQRVDGRAMVAFSPRGVRDMIQVAPARLLFPDGREGDFPLAVTVTTCGGLTGGDRLALDIIVDPGAAATIVPQAAEKLYRALDEDEPTRIDTRISIGAGATCEWLAQEAILFDRSRMRRTLEADLAPDARMLAMEMLVLGRGAMGEIYASGLIHDAWRIRCDGRLVWADTLHVEGDFASQGRAPFGFGDATAIATLVYAGPDAGDYLDLARSLFEGPGNGATSFDGLLILRLTAADPQALRKDVMRAAGILRAAIFGLSPTMPTICYC